jgi:hypothetical protein
MAIAFSISIDFHTSREKLTADSLIFTRNYESLDVEVISQWLKCTLGEFYSSPQPLL